MNIITYDDIYIIKILEFGLILPAFNKKPMTRVQYDCNEHQKTTTCLWPLSFPTRIN